MAAHDLALIVNPGANRGRSGELIERVEEILRSRNATYRLTRTKSYDEIGDAARAAREEGFPVVVSCGGDGTNRAVASALAGTETALGVVCGGRGNDLARALGIPLDAEGAVETLFHGRSRPIDVGRAGDTIFLTVAALGIDAEVSERVRSKGPGRLSAFNYPAALVRTVFTYRSPKVVLEGDFGRREGPILLAATANTPYYGKGMEIAPGANPEDGLFDLCVIRSIGRVKLLRVFPTVYRGAHLRYDEVEILRTREVRVECEETLPVYADGEFLGRTPIEMRVEPQSLRVLVPEGATV